jgi:flagellar basal body-associated protein FliL
MGKLIKVLIGFALLAAVGWFFATPYLAVKNMKDAADKRDAATLSTYVNYPALKENLKTTFATSMNAKAEDKSGNPLAGFGAALATAFLSPMVDAIVTPENLAMMMSGQKPKAAGGATEPVTQDATAKKQDEPDISLGYESLNRFAVNVTPKDKPEQKTKLIFLREGLSWKLNNVELPVNPK